ncbi:MAG: dihydropteroate synthase [Verrucomicrobia bacterium]|nr:dihydropteroate synthase [Verrucomicrobiota bacterium]
MEWSGRRFRFTFPRPVLVMGIVNVTPDSFSDGGRFLDPGAAIRHGLALAAEGADLLDVGGESTRPGAAPVSETEELRRVIPVIEGLAARCPVPISVDTQKPGVARAAVSAGAAVINDIAAVQEGSAMGPVVAETGAGYIAMHMQGTPGTMQSAPHYGDVVAEVSASLGRRLDTLAREGVRPGQVALDPGIGFGKTLEHNLDLLAHWAEFTTRGRPLVLGVSRKSFLGALLGTDLGDRLAGGLACTAWAASQGVQIVRTHDVAPTVQTLRVLEALRARAARSRST